MRLLSLALFFCLVCDIGNSQDNSTCLMTNRPTQQPEPSLTYCYRNNPSTCCNSATDYFIKLTYLSMISTSCLRSFPQLEIYFCFACSPDQPVYTNLATKQLYLCKSFVQGLWNADITGPTTAFDACGMVTVWSQNPSIILPSQYWSNAADFLKEVLPPFFSNYTIVIVDDSVNQSCFSFASRAPFSFLLVLSVASVFLLIF